MNIRRVMSNTELTEEYVFMTWIITYIHMFLCVYVLVIIEEAMNP